jgi:hypothetical protein
MNIESKEGCGTTVSLEFPINIVKEDIKILEPSSV